MKNQTVVVTHHPLNTVDRLIGKSDLYQGIIGIQIPPMISVNDLAKFYSEVLFHTQSPIDDRQYIVIPQPSKDLYDLHSGSAGMAALVDRIRREKLDGIRYNRIAIAIYWDDAGIVTKDEHDLFFELAGDDKDGYAVVTHDNTKNKDVK
jgi:hypothetical protein